MDLKRAQQTVCIFNNRRVSRPQQVIDIIDYQSSNKHKDKVPLYESIVAVLQLHLERYLRGHGHPAGCADMVTSLAPSVTAQLAAIDSSILRASLLLRVSTDFESLPINDSFKITVGS
jgi:hypothetical protein